VGDTSPLTVNIDPDGVVCVTYPEGWTGCKKIKFRAKHHFTFLCITEDDYAVFTVWPSPIVADIPDQCCAPFEPICLNNYLGGGVDPNDVEWHAEGNVKLQVDIDPDTHCATITNPLNCQVPETICFVATLIDHQELCHYPDCDAGPCWTSDEDCATFDPRCIPFDIPDQCVAPGQSFEVFDADDYLEPSCGPVCWSLACDPSPLNVQIDLNGVVTVTYPEGWEGCKNLTFKATAVNGGECGCVGYDGALFTVAPSPIVGDIPDQTQLACDEVVVIDLDDYLSGIDPADVEWTASGAADLNVEIDPNTHQATITNPGGTSTTETITFEACVLDQEPDPIECPLHCWDCAEDSVTFEFICLPPEPQPQPCPDCPTPAEMVAVGWFCPGASAAMLTGLLAGACILGGRARRR
jgi:hypothetical protein